MPRGTPQVYGDEEALLKQIDPDFETKESEEASKENALRQKLARKENMIEGISDELYGLTTGQGYLRPPNAMGRGYLAPANVSGGWIFPLLAGILPALFGSGIRGRGSYRPLMLTHAPNITSASAFYRDIMRQAHGQGVSPNTFVKLFGDKKTLNDMLSGKMGSGVQDNLKMGHLLAPLVHGHLKKALKGTGLAPEQVMLELESAIPQIFDQPVTPEVMARGGSLLGTLWGGVKNIFGKVRNIVKGIISNPKVQDIGRKTLNKIGDVADKRAPELAEIAANKVADYARKRLKGDEPEAEIEEEEEEIPRRKKFEPSATRKFEQPSASRDGTMRKKIIAERQNKKAVVPVEDEQPQRRIVGYSSLGNPVYGVGKKKRTVGGAWSVRLVRG